MSDKEVEKQLEKLKKITKEIRAILEKSESGKNE
jgi:hypothetical protein